ncbi:MAG: N-acetylmuramoyl-L-alanine amidase CwlD, partial [Sporomusa sp.]|nr:N-acetylmuramoyl-L-alanine amidase CwlD [Sporomusa sp.]
MYNKKKLTILLLLMLVINILGPVQVSHAATIDNVIGTLAASSVPSTDGGANAFDKLFSLLFDKILGPILNIFGGGKATTTSPNNPIKVTPLPS